LNDKDGAAVPNSPLRFGANAFGQQADMWLAYARPNFALRRNFTYPRDVKRNCQGEGKEELIIFFTKGVMFHRISITAIQQ